METKAGLRVLLVEDDCAHALMITKSLDSTGRGVDAVWVRDGVEAIYYLQRLREAGAGLPGLLLLDLTMPRMSGQEVLAAVKADPHLRAIPVVVMTGSASPQDIRRMYDHHANGYVVKPQGWSEFQSLCRVLVEYWGQWNHTAPLAEHRVVGERPAA